MKTTIYIEQFNEFQIVLTPENKFERQIVDSICPTKEVQMKATVFLGGFTHTVGGYIRESANRDQLMIKMEGMPNP